MTIECGYLWIYVDAAPTGASSVSAEPPRGKPPTSWSSVKKHRERGDRRGRITDRHTLSKREKETRGGQHD